MKRVTWLDIIAADDADGAHLTPQVRAAFSRLDERLFDIWNLGENVLLAWTFTGHSLQVLAVRHYAIAEAVTDAPGDRPADDTAGVFNEILAGQMFLATDEFRRACGKFGVAPQTISLEHAPVGEPEKLLINRMVGRYGVSLVKNRAVVLIDAVQFSLQPPLQQVAMLNSLSYSLNSAYRQLLSKDIQVNFARTTTGDGFYIWNRANTAGSNIALYKLMMMVLADNAIAQRKAHGNWVPRLRTAFHVGSHYEFYQVEALNPTTFSYIVGEVTIDLSRMIEKALPGQILIGDFSMDFGDEPDGNLRQLDSLSFVERTASTLDQLKGLTVAGDRIASVRCYLTGQPIGGDRFPVNRYEIEDKHGTRRLVYNAKINIHRESAEPIFLGAQAGDLREFPAARVEVVAQSA